MFYLFWHVMPRTSCAPFVHITFINLLCQVVVEPLLHFLGALVGLILADYVLHADAAAVILIHSRAELVNEPNTAAAAFGVAVLLKVAGLDVMRRATNSRQRVGTGPFSP